MAQAQDLKQTITSVAGRPGPVLSAYLSVNADIPENQRRAYLVRLRVEFGGIAGLTRF